MFDAVRASYNPMELFADYVSRKEEVHSKILADLLNPSGEHQLGYGFLTNFLRELNIIVETQTSPTAGIPIKVINISTEHPAPANINGENKNGRIDIFLLLECAEKQYAIIIENKLNDAGDQPQQLKRYNEYVRTNHKIPDTQIRTVYLPRIDKKCEYDDTKVINATELAAILDKTLSESNSPAKPVIQAYSNYLKNISINNIIMNNAKILSEMTEADILNAKAIKEAYDMLPQAFAKTLKEDYEENGYKTEISADYPHYCYIWNKTAYDKTSLWLAVGFNHSSYFIYVVSNNEEKLNKENYVSELEIVKSNPTKGYYWLRPENENDFTGDFKSKNDFNQLYPKIDEWLKKLQNLPEVVK